MFLTFCCLCGGPPENDLDAPRSKYNWLKIIGAILPSDKYAFGDYNENGDIEMGTYIVNVEPESYDSGMVPLPKRGFLVHRECFKLAKNVKNIYAKLASFTRKKSKSGHLSGLSYTPLAKYSDQLFDWDRFYEKESDHYALENPTFNAKNKKRIMDNIKKVDAKTIKIKAPVDLQKFIKNKRKAGYSLSRKTGKWVKIKSRSKSRSKNRK